MGRSDYTTCRECGGHKGEVGELSHSRLCAGCAEQLLAANVIGIATKAGPAFHRWRRGMIAYVVGALLDEPPTRGHSPD